MTPMIAGLRKRIRAAQGLEPADVVLKAGRVVNVFSGEIRRADVAVCDGMIVGLGDSYTGEEEVDVSGRWVLPGLIDGHIHIESSMLTPAGFAEALVVHGTTTVVADPHEIANVAGLDGVRYMLRESRSLPFDIFFTAPSCVPATGLETAGAELDASDLAVLKEHPRVLGLAEVMNFPGLLAGDTSVLEKIDLFRCSILDGHCPSLTGRNLQGYRAAGIGSDHEATGLEEAKEKLDSGMFIMIREGTSARNMETLLPLVTQGTAHRFCFVSDDLHAEEIRRRGHLDFVLAKAVRLGMDPVTAVKLVTVNPAGYFGLRGRGAVAPGFCADMVVVKDLESFDVVSVYKHGRKVAEDGAVTVPFPGVDEYSDCMRRKPLNTGPLSVDSFAIPHGGGKARVIEVVPGQLLTNTRLETVQQGGGAVVPDTASDILKLCVVERHRARGTIGLGLVRGFGFKRGAIAGSVAHDSHNVIGVGVTDRELHRAVDEVRRMGGGLVVVDGDEVRAAVPLEIAGLMSTKPLRTVVRDLESLKEAATGLGGTLEEPFMTLSFLALPVIPELKLTDRGLVDVGSFRIVPLFVNSVKEDASHA